MARESSRPASSGKCESWTTNRSSSGGGPGRPGPEPVVGQRQRRLALLVGRPQDIAFAQQLGAEAVVDPDPMQEDAVEQQQPEAVLEQQPAVRPGAGGQLDLARDHG